MHFCPRLAFDCWYRNHSFSFWPCPGCYSSLELHNYLLPVIKQHLVSLPTTEHLSLSLSLTPPPILHCNMYFLVNKRGEATGESVGFFSGSRPPLRRTAQWNMTGSIWSEWTAPGRIISPKPAACCNRPTYRDRTLPNRMEWQPMEINPEVENHHHDKYVVLKRLIIRLRLKIRTCSVLTVCYCLSKWCVLLFVFVSVCVSDAEQGVYVISLSHNR